MPVESANASLKVARSFLEAVAYERPQVPDDDVEMTAAITASIRAWGMPSELEKDFLNHMPLGIGIAKYLYGGVIFPVRVLMGVIGIGVVWTDNRGSKYPAALFSFTSRFYSRRPQLNPVFQGIADAMLEFYDYFEETVANQMVACQIAYIEGAVLELRTLGTGANLSKHATMYPMLVRMMAGGAEMFSWSVFPQSTHPNALPFIQAQPQMARLLNLSNDILSFYKEELDGETDGYIHSVARVTGEDPLNILARTAQESVVYHKQIRCMLAHDAKALRDWDRFIMGFYAYHLDMKRYRLPRDLADGIGAATGNGANTTAPSTATLSVSDMKKFAAMQTFLGSINNVVAATA